jgi:diguanylate cyclase (GGDEF)-like protein/PAS domain S-box-containing protein
MGADHRRVGTPAPMTAPLDVEALLAVQQACLDALEQGVAHISTSGDVLLLNRAGQEMTGYSPDDLGARFRSGTWVNYRLDGSVIPEPERPIVRSTAGEIVRGAVVGWRTKDGDELLVRVTSEPVRDHGGRITGVVVAFVDITAEHAAKTALEAVHARFAALVERSTDIICVIDRSGGLVYASPAGERLLGYQVGSQQGRPFAELVHPDDVGVLTQAFVELLVEPGGERTLETRIRDAAGGWRNVEIAATNRIDDPAVGGVIANVRDVTERATAAARISWQAFHDPLTGLANRALLLDRIGEAVASERHGPGRATVLYLDLDGFKQVNDRHGHPAGDQLLVEVAARLRAVARERDTVARVGGDEFVVLLDPVRWQPDAGRVAQRILEVLSQPYELPFGRVEVGVSIGIALDAAGDPTALLRDADAALYRAKADGKGCWVVFDSTLRAEEATRQAGANALRRALVSDDLRVLLEPFVDLRTGTVAGGQAVLDLVDATGAQHGGAELLAVAEETGLIVPIGAGLLDAAADAGTALQARGRGGLVIADVSIHQLRASGFHALLDRVLSRHDLLASNLAIEVDPAVLGDTDRVVLANLAHALDVGIGVVLGRPASWEAIDRDAGRLRCTAVKVSAGTPDLAALVERCEAVGLLVIADGITSVVGFATARSAGCRLGQGPWLAVAQRADELPARVNLAGPPAE